MKFLMILSSLLFIIISCNNENTIKVFSTSPHPPKDISREQKYSIELKDTVFAPLYDDISSSSIFTYKMFQDSLYYFVYNNNKLAVLNIKTDSIKKIPIPDYILQGGIKAIEPISRDSIFFTYTYPDAVFLVTTKDSIHVEKKELKGVNIGNKDHLEYGDDTNFNLDFNNLVYDGNKKTLHIGIEAIDSDTSQDFVEESRIGVFDWDLGKWLYTYCKPKGYYSTRSKNSFGKGGVSVKNFIIKNDTIFVSHPVNHYVEYYNTEGIFLGEKPFTSSHSKKILPPLSPKEFNEIEPTRDYISSTPQYSYIYYHETFGIFSRIYIDEQPAINEDGYRNEYDDRNAHVVFMDKNFNHVGEFRFPKKSFSYHMVPTTDGFLLRANKYDITDPNDEFFPLRYEYKIFEIN